jgi:hypothetical protein
MVARLAARVKPSGLTTVVKIGFFRNFSGLVSGVRVVLRFSGRGPPTPSLPHGGALVWRRARWLALDRGFHTPGPPWDIWGGKNRIVSIWLSKREEWSVPGYTDIEPRLTAEVKLQVSIAFVAI